jgi:hypothetical protein
MDPNPQVGEDKDLQPARHSNNAVPLDSGRLSKAQASVVGDAVLNSQRQSGPTRLYMAFYYVLVVSALLVIAFTMWTTAQRAMSGRQVNATSGIIAFGCVVPLVSIAIYFRSKTFSD